MSDTPASSLAASTRRGGLAIVGLVCALAAMPAYFMLMDFPLLRSTGLPTWIGLGLGCILAVYAAIADRRWWVRSIGGVCGFMLVASVAAWFGMGALPKSSGTPIVGSPAPVFSLPGSDGRPVVLAEQVATGPVLLVFYRGFW